MRAPEFGQRIHEGRAVAPVHRPDLEQSGILEDENEDAK